jgi:dienelactone hydrolase
MTAGSWIAGWARAAVLLGALACMPGVACAADLLVEEELRIADLQARPNGLEALLVRPRGDGRFPLALINHGSPRSAAERPNMTPWAMLPQAREFARRGWAAVVVMRRGYGGSGGGWAESYGGCAHPNYVAAGAAAAADLKAAAAALAQRPDIDPARTISVGVSAGGFATVALTADPPPGLAAAISFAGGRGSLEADEVCQQDKLVEGFRAFGSRSRVPMLWVYAENDHFFGPELAQKLRAAFIAGGGIVDFVRAPAFENEGHQLFSQDGIPIWSPLVDSFLRKQNLVMREQPLPLPRPSLAAPAALSANGRKAFETYLLRPPHKAFALSPDGHFGWQSGVRTTAEARSGALKYCGENARACAVVFVDDAEARGTSADQ